MAGRNNRQKISTTIAPENGEFLKSLIRRGKASTMAEAVDRAVSIARRAERRRQLEVATAAYYASLEGEALREEQELERAVGHTTSRINYDGE
ncbi:MAG: hypothetical protein WBE13_14575 [Candidatus Acidiferrum sp.]